MKLTIPKVYLIGETRIVQSGLYEYLKEVGAEGWTTDTSSHAEELVEVYGRMCYRSFKPGLNPNVTKVRQGSKAYFGNIIKTGHGSICEHSSTNWIFHNVSRVFTHELVRHRAGTAISQESLRFVRVEDINMFAPTVIKEEEDKLSCFISCAETIEKLYSEFKDLFHVDGVPFSEKKIITSALRRLLPMGLATSIGWTANLRALRHVIEMRTSRYSEEEIRFVFDKVASIVRSRYPNIFQDYTPEFVDGYNEWVTPNTKI
jgi:thymidylate synthase (FAD)